MFTFITLLVLVALALLGLPLARMRQLTLTAIHNLLQIALWTVVVGAGVLSFWPGLEPERLSSAVEPLATSYQSVAPPGMHGYFWLGVAVAFAAVALPILTHLEYARRIAEHTASLARLGRELREMRRALHATQAAASTDPHAGEEVAAAISAADALEAMQWLTGAGPTPPPRKRRVKDYLAQPAG
jgi:hypothetical protein